MRLLLLPSFLQRPAGCPLTSEVCFLGQRERQFRFCGRGKSQEKLLELLSTPRNTRFKSLFKSWFHQGLCNLERVVQWLPGVECPPCSRSFVFIISYNSHSNPARQIILSPFCAKPGRHCARGNVLGPEIQTVSV